MAQHLQQTEEFNNLLKEFTPHKLIEKEVRKQNYFLNKIKRERWVDGQPLKMGFRYAENSSAAIGGLIPTNKIKGAKYKDVTITEHKFMSFALKFLERDLKKHGDLRTSFIKILPEEIRMAARRKSYLFNLIMFDKGRLVEFLSNGAADGKIKVKKPQRLEIGQRVQLDFDVSPALPSVAEAFVGAVNMNTKEVTFVQEDMVTPIDLSGYLIANEEASKRSGAYIVGHSSADGFTSLIDIVYTSAMGGGVDTLYEGKINKLDNPIHQSILTDASSWTKSTLLDNLIDFYYDTEDLGQVSKRELTCGYGVFKEVAKKLETSKRYTGKFSKGTLGMSQLEIIGTGKPMTITAVEQMPDDKAMILPFEDYCLATDQFVEHHKDLNGNMYHIERVAGTSNDGYEAVCDLMTSGEVYCKRGSQTAGIYGLSL